MKKFKLIFLIILMIIFLGTAIYSAYNIYLWWVDNNKTKEQISQIYNVVDISADSKSKTLESKYLKVNFDELEKMNNEVVGWIEVVGTNINYPIVQHTDNDYYLNHSFDKSYNNAGWPFLDYRNDLDELDSNTIIYAHGRVDKTMFGSLRDVLTDDWIANQDNYIVKVSTANNDYLFKVFSTYHITTTNDYVKTNFSDEVEFDNFVNLIKGRTTTDFTTEVSSYDKILTLSTCYNNWEKMVLHAKLIEHREK